MENGPQRKSVSIAGWFEKTAVPATGGERIASWPDFGELSFLSESCHLVDSCEVYSWCCGAVYAPLDTFSSRPPDEGRAMAPEMAFEKPAQFLIVLSGKAFGHRALWRADHG